MRVPLSWLRECVDVPSDATAHDVQAALVRMGLEEENIHGGECVGPIVVGEILGFVEEPQKNGKTIRWCQVQVAPSGVEAAVRGIVCGAHNFAVGDKVVVALPGSVLPGPFPITARKTYGHVSDGMIASARELGLSDDHEGILVLSSSGLGDGGPEVGTDALHLLGLDATAVEINVTPDRGYALSIRGVAREYSHSTGRPFRDPAANVVINRGTGFTVTVDDTAPIRGRTGCSIFVTRVVREVDVTRPTPVWMASRLRLAGIRSVSLIVDITNYVMLEFGQPLHAYDLDLIHDHIIVRRAQPNETCETLDAKPRILDSEDLVIADISGVIGVAGVMGGARTEIHGDTQNVLIEAANFDPVSIARTSRRHKLSTEASKRFERGVDPAIAEGAAARAIDLLIEWGGGKEDTLGSFTGTLPPACVIELPAGYVSGLVGVTYSAEEIREALEEVGARVAEKDDSSFTVTAPSWRPDLINKASLAEEVARINGYDRIPSRVAIAPAVARNRHGIPRALQLRTAASTVLAANGGVEVFAYPFVSADNIEKFSSLRGPVGSPVRVANPLDAQRPFLRVSLLPGLMEVAHRNVSRGFTDVAIFEQGLVFLPEDGARYGVRDLPGVGVPPSPRKHEELDTAIPPQPRYFAGLFLGNAWPKQPGLSPALFSWNDALAAVELIAHAVNVQIGFRQGQHPAYHPGRTAEIYVESTSQVVGYAGELLPKYAEQASLPPTLAAFEIDFNALTQNPAPVKASQLRTKPPATQDLSLVVPENVPAAEILDTLIRETGELLEHATLIDDYRGAGIPEGTKSLTFALRFRAADRTLTTAEANDAKNRGVAAVGKNFGAHIRE